MRTSDFLEAISKSNKRSADELTDPNSGYIIDSIDFNQIAKTIEIITPEISNIVQCSLDTHRAIKELELICTLEIAKIHQQGNNFENALALIEKRLESSESRINRIMDQVEKIDPHTCSKEVLEHRGQLLQTLSQLTLALSQMTIKLLSL